MSLEEAESSEFAIFIASFAHNKSIEFHPKMRHFWPLIYTDSTVDYHDLELQVCHQIETSTFIQIPFYIFYYNLDIDTRNKLNQTIRNGGLFIDELLKEPREYINEDIVELIKTPDGLAFPPQEHLTLVSKICMEYLSQINIKLQQMAARKRQQRGGQRRRGQRGHGHS
uniref:Uncharacterized protein n=1 Tax=Meloidogyne hapla TaxID=6305 RepID=A0A1I8BTY8_MELHA